MNPAGRPVDAAWVGGAVRAAGAVTLGIGGLGLLGWFADLPGLTTWSVAPAPMALGVSVFTTLFGCSAICSSSTRSAAQATARGLSAVGAVLAMTFAVARAAGVPNRFEWLAQPGAGTNGDASRLFVFPLTALCFAIANVTMLALLTARGAGSWRPAIGRVGSMSLVATGFALTIANILGAPLVLDLVVLPVPLSVSVVILINGLALWWLTLRVPAPRYVAAQVQPYLWVFLAIVVITTAVGYAYYRELERDLRADTEQSLVAVADLTRLSVSQWRRERLGDAQLIHRDLVTTAALQRVVAGQQDDDGQLTEWFRGFSGYLQYDRLFVFGSGGEVRASLPAAAGQPARAIVQQVANVIRTGQTVLQDFYLDEDDEKPHLATLVPILGAIAGEPPIGVLALRIDPEPFLYPYLNRWPLGSKSAEVLLVRRDRDQVVFLNALRFDAAAALRLRIPLARTESLAVKAALGETGILEGLDYRGEPVIGVVSAIPDSPWHLVARMDVAEFRERLWQRLRVVSALVVLLLFSAASGLGVMWRNRRVAFYKERAALATSLQAASATLMGLLDNSPTVIYRLTAVDGHLVLTEVSSNVRRILGFSPMEVLQPHWWVSNLHPDDRAAALANLAALDRDEELTHEYRFYRKDGRELFISDHQRVVQRDAAGIAEVTGAWNEVTERRKAEEFLRDSEERLRMALSAANQGTFDLNVQTGEVVVSPEYATQIGYAPDEFTESNAAWLARIHPEDRPRAEVAYQDYVNGRTADYRVEFRHRTKQGGWLWTLSVGRVVSYTSDGQPLRMLGTHTDIHARKIAELRSQRLAQMYAALSRCNEAIVRSASEAELFPLICEAAVSHGGMAMAWVGMVDAASGAVTPVASFGAGTEYLDGIKISVRGDSPFGRGPTGTAIRENRAIWLENFPADPSTAPWHERARRFAWATSVGLPLTRGGRAVGALTIYALTADAFDQDGRELLTQMAADISFALDTFGRDARRIGAEAAVRASLREKEALLKEVHHRVKNNLQVITSLLRLEAGRSLQPNVVAALAEMQSRVLSMALLHETLYRSDNLALVDLAAYLTQLGHQIVRSLAPAAGVTLQLEVEPIRLDLDQALPCGLIVNELMSNALKHAFPDGRHGDIRITARLVDGGPAVRLSVADSGAGLPADFDQARKHSLGLQLVTDLVRQLHGTLDIASGHGTTFSLTFIPKSTAGIEESPTAS